jgi:hypothetical protein
VAQVVQPDDRQASRFGALDKRSGKPVWVDGAAVGPREDQIVLAVARAHR